MNTRIRFIIIGFLLLVGIALHIKIGWTPAWYLYLSAIIILATHFLFGNVWAAFAMLRKGKVDEAETLLNQIKRPDLLSKQHRAYYHFTKGMIAIQYERLEEGEFQLKEALQRGLRSGNDNALTALNIAHIYFKQQKTEPCRKFLYQAKSYKPNDLLIKEKITELERVLASPYN